MTRPSNTRRNNIRSAMDPQTPLPTRRPYEHLRVVIAQAKVAGANNPTPRRERGKP
jgi:hypothetical protein